MNRRQFVTGMAGALATIPVVVTAEDTPSKLALDDPQAGALGYVEDSATVDSGKYPNHKPEQLCSNCALYQSEDADWGPCAIFPGKLVAGPGWCAAYAPKA